MKCEFCGRRHTAKDDICDIRTNEYDSGNSLEKDGGAYNITLGDLNKMLEQKRDLVFEFIIISTTFEKKDLTVNLTSDKNDMPLSGKGGGMNLSSCFKAFSTEELLTGDDQWYCNKCKEFVQAKKTLILHRVPRIMIITLKRFKTSRSRYGSSFGFG